MSGRYRLRYRPDMRVPVRFFATRRMLEGALGDRSVEQALNAATLPGLVGHVAVMPDVHQGYGFPIGGVAATRFPEGVISPGGIGYDINCGVRLLSSVIPLEDAQPCLEDLVLALDRHCPSGVGVKGGRMLNSGELEQVCRQGAGWAVKQGFGEAVDLARTESVGCLEGADPAALSRQARERGQGQLGSLGAGNHFIEIDVVRTVFDPEDARRPLGCSKAAWSCRSTADRAGWVTRFARIPSRPSRRSCSVTTSNCLIASWSRHRWTHQKGRQYLAAMRCAANYAFANRHMLAVQARAAFDRGAFRPGGKRAPAPGL